MKLSSHKIESEFTPLKVSSSLTVTGGSVVQFFDGANYTPNREGTPASPILITHSVSAFDSDANKQVVIALTTTFYENNVVISAGTNGYELLPNALKVTKNIIPGTAVEIKAISKFIDIRNNKIYEREDKKILRTITKAEAQYELNLSQSGVVFFDAYRNPNVTTAVVAELMQGSAVVTDFTGITLKWTNSAGLNVIDNELYADAVSLDQKTLTVDKTYIDRELITCEAWKDETLIASENVTFIRKFNSFRTNIIIPELPIQPGTTYLNCSIEISDMLGNINVDSAFLVTWMVSENNVERALGTGAKIKVPVSSINLNAANLMIYPDVKRRGAFAALTTDNTEELLTDDLDNVLTVETYGA